ncbi:MAG: ABC transporter substrate-binding protein [Alphaproteobacteria bacterium]|nr:ABC transporter substrate-binding protein [Alphaproteobacteria bacterium]
MSKPAPILVRLALAAAALVLALVPTARAQEKITYLFPAPQFLPAFAPWVLAMHKGYYKAAGLDVEFVIGKGGADVAKQVGAGNADLGGGIGDTSIIVRPNGVPVRSVALLGGGSLMQLIVRADSPIQGPKDLKGRVISVTGYQDTTYYALLGVLASVGLGKADVDAQAGGPAGVVKLFVAGTAPAMAAVPEWAVQAEREGVAIRWYPSGQYFPSMAQAIIAADETIAKRPAAIRGFVQATIRAVGEIMKDPKAAAIEYVAAVPQHKGKEAEMATILGKYAEIVYPGQAKLGAMDEARLAKLQDFYVEQGIVRAKTPVADLFTNQFVN